MKNTYDSGLDILGASSVIGHRGRGGRRHGGHRGPWRGGYRARGFGPGWGWPGYYDPYDGDTYIVNYVDVPDEDEDEEEIFGSADVLGMIDIGARQREMNTLRKVPVTVARILVKDSMIVIDRAIKLSLVGEAGLKAMIGQPTILPGDSKRKDVLAHLQWHANELAKYANAPEGTFYPNGDDLKKWCMQAWIEANAVEEGNKTAGSSAYLDIAWGSMWAKITDAIARLPQAMADQISKFTMPEWAKWTVGGLAGAVVLGLGFGVYSRVKG